MGKRLPTALEWKRAARGTSGRLFPWGDEGEDDPDLVRSRVNAWKETMGPYNRWIGDRGLVAHYISNVHPTDDTTTDDLCDGNLLHMFGNVQEWTETPQDPTRFGLPADPLSRVICGASWGNPPQNNWTFESEGFGSMDGAIMGRGFRCAKSALE